MDVRCEKCLTEYEFDDARVTDAGVTVKCTTCGHVFKVRKPSAEPPPGPASFMAPPVRSDEFAPEASQIDRAREWKIRQPAGNIFTCRELTTLQKWIVERKVSREDEISLTGESWKRLGDIPELAGFFLVVDQANKAQFLEQQMRVGPASGPTVMSAPAQQQRPTTGGYQLGAPPQRRQDPAWMAPPPGADDVSDDDLRAIKKGHSGLWIGFAVVLLAGAAGAYFYLHSQGLIGAAQHPVSPTTPANPQPPAPTPVATTPPPAPKPAPVAVVDAGPAYVDAGPAYVDAGPAYVDAGPAYVDAGAVKMPGFHKAPEVAPTAAAPHPKTFEGLMAEGSRLEKREHFAQALQAYEQATELEPGSAEAWAGKAAVLNDMSEYAQAEQAFRHALGISPRFSDAEFGLADVLKSEGKKADAVKQYKKFIDDHPDDDNASIARRNISDLSD